jgi:hypothetical protein
MVVPCFDGEYFANAIDVTLDEVPTEPVTQGKRSLEVHAPTRPEVSECGPFERGPDRVGGETLGTGRSGGEADSIDGDAVADAEPLERGPRADGEVDPASDSVRGDDDADLFDDTRKHDALAVTSAIQAEEGV